MLAGSSPGIEAQDGPREAERRAPDGPVHRVVGDAVEAGRHAVVLRRVDLLVRLGVFVAASVAVGVEHQGGPALRGLLVAGLEERLRVQPADDRPAAAGPERVVLVLGEYQMMRAVARTDEGHLLRVGIPDGQVPPRAGVGKRLRRRVVRPVQAHRRVVGAAHPRGEPDAAGLIEHRVVDVGLAVPDRLVPPVGRGRQRRARRDRRVGVAHRHRHLGGGVGHRIEHRHVVRARLERAVDRAVGVDRRVALVGGDLVVQVGLRIGPVPLRHDDAALHPLRPARRLRGQFAGQDAVGPVGEHLERAAAPHPVQPVRHRAAGLTRLDAPVPGRDHRVELAQLGRDLARRQVAEGMAGGAAARLHGPHPLRLAPHVGRDAIAVGAGAGELVPARNLEEREPVAGRVVLRRRGRIRRDDGGQVERRAGRRPDLLRVDQPVAADPDVVGRVRQVGKHVAAVVVGHDDAVEAGGQVARLRNHPDAGLGAVGSRDDAADVVRVDVDGAGLARRRRGRHEKDGEREARGDGDDRVDGPHAAVSLRSPSPAGLGVCRSPGAGCRPSATAEPPNPPPARIVPESPRSFKRPPTSRQHPSRARRESVQARTGAAQVPGRRRPGATTARGRARCDAREPPSACSRRRPRSARRPPP